MSHNYPAQPPIALELPSIEGEEIRVDGQKLEISGIPKKIPGLVSGVGFPVSAKISARGKLTKPYEAASPKVIVGASTKRGDEIAGEIVFGYSSEPITNKDIVVGEAARSASHRRQSILLSGGAVATLVKNSFGGLVTRHPSQLFEAATSTSTQRS